MLVQTMASHGIMRLQFVSAACQPIHIFATCSAFGELLHQPPEMTAQAVATNAFASAPPVASGKPPG